MTMRTRSRRIVSLFTRGAVALSLTLSALAVAETATAPAAAALVPPVLNSTPEQVSAEPLPTVQINGVVWDQEIVGNTVYAVGEFTQARPAGSPAGTNQTARANVLAYNLSTGALIPGFVANTNGTVRTVTKSPDGQRIYIGGQFTQVNGTNRYRIAALNPTTGAVITGFNAIAGSTVKDLVATSTTVYAGGIFTSAGGGAGVARSKLAAFSATTGAVTAWAPTASANVETMLLTPDGSKLIVGGIFLQLNGQSAYGMGALDPANGALLPWAANQVVKNGGSFDGAILNLFTDGTSIFGNGFTFGRAAGNLEGVFKANATTGAITWVQDCHGDTYQATVTNGFVYTASHAHFCGNVGGFPQSSDQHLMWAEYQRHSLAFKDEVAGTLRRDNWSYHNLEGLPAPSMTTWFPEWTPGTYTGQGQATWATDSNSDYVVYGGEFTRINSTNQQGLVRFATRAIAPNDSGPRLTGNDFAVNVVSESAGQARLSWPANFDRDDGVLSYDIVRNGATIETISSQSTYWDQPALTYLDTGLTPGQSYTYRVRVRDPWGNAQLSNQFPVTIASSGAPTTYANRVLNDGPALYWRLGDGSGASAAADEAGIQTGAVNDMTFGRPGAIIGDPDTAASPNSTASRVVQPPLVNRQDLLEAHATRDDVTVETWFRTTSGQGGRLLGFGSSNTGSSNTDRTDRLLYVSDQGRVLFGVRTRAEGTGNTSSRVRRTIQSGTGLNDGQWHHVVGTLASDGMRLYVDGVEVSSRSDVNSGHGYYGYWRVGADVINNAWTSSPTSTRLNGDIDEAAVYYHALDASQIASHWNVSGHGSGDPAPIAGFTSSTNGLTASFDASTSSDPGGSIVSYAWNFGDGTFGSGISPSHLYAAGGTYDVTLTVTDNAGGIDTEQQPVNVVAANVGPTALFTADPTDLDVDFDGTGSTDGDGVIASYAWAFGDGGTAIGATPSHSYAAAGTYNVTLTVTDDDGAIDDITLPVTVSEPGAPTVYAADTFERTVAGGLGSADTGGAWASSGSAAAYSVTGGVGRQQMTTAGTQRNSFLDSVSAQDVLATVDVAWDKVPDANGVYASLIVRRTGTSDYRVRIRAFNTKTTITLYRMVSNVETSLGVVTLPTLVYGAGDTFRLQLRAVGSGTTNLQAKVWRVGTAEPGAAQITANDATASLQVAGGVGLVSYLSGAATNAPVIGSFDNLLVTEP
ncbi:MAG: PKD domain-containing protein [Acidimicrobiales bacterium]